MILRQLEYLVALARERHFGRAAAACHVSQPALSMAVRKLEAELGLRLVDRGSGGVALTDAGRELLGWAQSAVGAADALAAEAGRLRGQLTATLRLGVIPTAVTAVSAVVGPLLRAHPGVRIEMRTWPTERIVAGLTGHALDAGLTYVDDPSRELAVVPLYRERFDLPLCLLTDDMQHRRIVDATLRRAGLHVEPRIEADSFGVLLDLVRDGWSTVVGHAWLAGRALPPSVAVHPLVGPVVAPTVGLVTPGTDPATPVVRAIRASLAGVDLQAWAGPVADD
jgi:DNA-binding transcriptional LysR family regulator